MSKHIKVSLRPAKDEPKVENWKRRQRRRRLKAKIMAKRDYMAGWVDRKAPEARV